MGKLLKFLGNFFGSEDARSPENPLVQQLREKAVHLSKCNRLLEADWSNGDVEFRDSFPAAEDKTRSKTILLALSVERHLPDPKVLIPKAKEENALSLAVLGKDPIPCNKSVLKQTEEKSFPISSWMTRLEEAGFQSNFFFMPDGLVLINAWKDKPVVLKDEGDSIMELASSFEPGLLCKIHSGWEHADGGLQIDGMGVIYVLNRLTVPIRLNISCVANAFEGGTLRLHRSFSYIDENDLGKGRDIDVTFEPTLVPPGGHGLQFVSTDGTPIVLTKMVLNAEPYPLGQFQISLSFDQYQRHRIMSDILSGLFEDKEKPKILDVGGGGSLLSSFLTGAEIVTLDSMQYDRPNHIQDKGENLPFDDCAFDAVVSVDTLEHVPETNRKPFLDELTRVSRRWVVLACPFQNEKVDAAEKMFASFESEVRNSENAFLNDHLTNGLPDLKAVWEHLGQSLTVLTNVPNGWLPRWFAMMVFQSAMVAHLDYFPLGGKITRLYNKNYYRFDNAEPAYRHILIGSKKSDDVATATTLVKHLRTKVPTGNPSLEDPKKLLAFYGIPISEVFKTWYEKNKIEEAARALR